MKTNQKTIGKDRPNIDQTSTKDQPKNDQKTIKKSIKKWIRFWIDFRTNLAPLWEDLGAKMGPCWLQMAPKVDSKNGTKNDHLLDRFKIDF